MRDNHEGMPELLQAYERDGNYFGTIEITTPETAQLEFGVELPGYECLKRVFQMRPFDSAAGIPYRYFFTGGYRSTDEAGIRVRIELNQKAKTVDFPAPFSLVANLLWFRDLKKLEDASQLRRIDPS